MKKRILTIITIVAFVLITACSQGIFQNGSENKKEYR